MKSVLLIRHAKSDWGNPGLADFDRPLNERGNRDVLLMSEHLFQKKINIDCFIASPAKRAAKTAKVFAGKYNKTEEDIIFKKELYLPMPAVFLSVLSGINEQINDVALFSHNNGITDFANSLTNAKIDNIPTCGIFAIKAKCENWQDFLQAEKEFWFFVSPKSI